MRDSGDDGGELRTTVPYHALGELPRPSQWRRLDDYRLEDRPEGRFIAPVVTGPGVEEWYVDLPVAVFPLVADLDLEDEEAILGFVRRFGPMGTSAPGVLDVIGAQGLGIFEQFRAWKSTLRGWAREGEYIDEFRVGAGHIQGLAACRQELESEGRFSAARLRNRWSPWAPWKPPVNRHHAASWLVRSVNAGLAHVTPRLDQPDYRHPEQVDPALSEPETLVGLCALELYNHIVSKRRILRCANVTCGRLFTMQEGRSQYGGHRTDTVKYHTPACARAQAQREYRQRLAKRKGSRRASRKGGR